MSKTKKVFPVEQFFRALADRTRLRVLNLLGDDEVCVCFLSEILQTSQPSISRHLAYLKRVGVVASRREGKWMHYRIVEPADVYAVVFLADVRAWLAQDKAMQRDRKRLVTVCCSAELPVPLQGAPLPASVVSACSV